MSVRRIAISVAAIVALSFGLASCSDSSPEAQEKPAGASTEPKSFSTPVFYPEGTATENLPYFAYSLTLFTESDAEIGGQAIVDFLVNEGFAKDAMQVSFDRTKTDLQADAIFVSVRVGEECLLGQVTTKGRNVSSTVQPAIGPDNTLCLIGNTRPIDW